MLRLKPLPLLTLFLLLLRLLRLPPLLRLLLRLLLLLLLPLPLPPLLLPLLLVQVERVCATLRRQAGILQNITFQSLDDRCRALEELAAKGIVLKKVFF